MSMSAYPSFNQVHALTETDLEAAIHNGDGFSLTLEVIVPNNEVMYYVLKTPINKVVTVKGRTINTGGGLRYEPFIDGNWQIQSDISVIRNLNGRVNKPNETKLYTATVVDEGTSIDVVRTPAAQGSSGNPVTYAPDGAERILSEDKEYLLKFDNIDNSEIWCIYSLILTEQDITVFVPPEIITGDFVLLTGEWNDAGVWNDDEIWRDN